MHRLSDEAISDLCRGVPRRVPDGMKVFERFPLKRIPDSVAPIMADVLGQLALADAPVSGQLTACVLVAGDRGYGGHVVERIAGDTSDALTMALDAVPPGTTLLGAVVAGAGPIKEKHTLPSGIAFDRLKGHLVPNASFMVVQPNNIRWCRIIPAAKLETAYEPKVISVFQGETLLACQIEAAERTILSMEDCEFVANLRLAGLQADIHYYLTGSANGDSGPSCALKPGRYSDLDIIAVSELAKMEVEASFESVATDSYGTLQKTPKIVRIADSDRKLEGSIYSNANVAIDFYVSDDLEKAFVRPEYLHRNYFHQLS